MTPTNPGLIRRPVTPHSRAFTLVELLVVISIVVLLLSILLPSLAAARRQGQLVRCQSNMRQIATGFFIYAAENHGRFPPNLGAGGTGGIYWYQEPYLGRILTSTGLLSKGAVFSCPLDDDSTRSYSMNAWVSSAIDPEHYGTPPVGALWGPTPRDGSRVILIIESWSYIDSARTGFSALPIVGYRGDTPGHRFGADGGVGNFKIERLGIANCEIDYTRHRPRNSRARGTQPGGIVNIAYVDGHVAAKHEYDLVDMASGLSTRDSLWSPLDFEQNR